MTSEDTGQAVSFNNTLKYLDMIVDEALQMYELDNEKTNIVDELYHSLKVITDFLGYSVDLSPSILDLPTNTRVILSASLDILIIKPTGKSEQKRLQELTFEVIIRILEYAIPHIINQVRTERTDINEKVAFLRTATKKLQHLHSINRQQEISNLPMQLEG